MINSTLNADTPDPIIIALRAEMKDKFLDSLSVLDQNMEGWPNATLVVYGSTLMRQLALNEGIEFPLGSIKSSDIDIGVIEEKPKSAEFAQRISSHAVPIIKTAITNGDFNLETTRSGTDPKVYYPAEIKPLANSTFLGDFFITKTFSVDDIHKALQKHPEYEELKKLTPEEPITVKLVLGVNEKPFPALMDPIETTPESGEGKFHRTMALDMLAGKLVRSMTDKYKPTDLIDIYNLFHATRRDTGEPWLRLKPDEPNSVANTVRALVVSYLPMSRGIRPEQPELLRTFKNTPDNKSKFMQEVQEQIDARKLPELESYVDRIFDTLGIITTTIFSQRSQPSHGPLNLSDRELDFVNEIDGKRRKKL